MAIGATILGVTVLSAAASSIYAGMLGGRPLPALTQLVLDVHGTPGGYIFAFVTGIVATHACLVHFATSKARDVVSGTWVWLFLMTATTLAMTVYVGLSFLSLVLPLISIPGGMVQPTADSEAAEFRGLLVFAAVSVGSVVYALFLGVLMWRRGFIQGIDT